jgi:hypothetical protein
MRFLAITILTLFLSVYALEFPEQRSKEVHLFPEPPDQHTARINPPGFSWLTMESVDAYRFILKSKESGKTIIRELIQDDNVFVPSQTLEPGEYQWLVEALDSKSNVVATRRPYELVVPAGLIKQPKPDIVNLIDTLPETHPRLIFLDQFLPDFRATLQTTRRKAWKRLKATADANLDIPAPAPPTYDQYDIDTQYAMRRLAYQEYYRNVRPVIDEALQALSLAWLMTEDKKYAIAAKRILLRIASWDPFGITSSQHGGFDEVGLSLARCTHRAYDWLYNFLSEEEREFVRQNCIQRARDTFERVGIKRPFHQRPGSSHDGRLIGYLGEQALVLADEAPDEEVREWLDYSLEAFMTVYPHWGSYDGGWAEGMDYGPRYSMFITPWIEALRAVSQIDLWQRPFFRNIRHFFTYCMRPNAEQKPFGDGAEIGLDVPSRRTVALWAYLNLHAERFDDPVSAWWADQLLLPERYYYYPVIPMVPRVVEDIPVPKLSATAKYFSDVGWVAMHSDFSDLQNDIFMLFKSSPYASISHSHANQNAFHVSVGGRALAIASGYYGPVYGMPHHANWTRATKANNAILVNGKGQTIRDFTATGDIVDFNHQTSTTYVCGNATASYKGLLEKCVRHVVFVRPGVFVMLDDLKAPKPSTFQWLLHTLEPMEVDSDNQEILSRRKGAWLKVRLFNSLGIPMSMVQSDTFETPYLQGVPADFEGQLTDYWHETYDKDIVPHYHLQAGSDSLSSDIRIAAFMVAGGSKAEAESQFFSPKGWRGMEYQYQDGRAQVWARVDTGPIPSSLKAFESEISDETLVIGLWVPREGDSELITGTAYP